MATTLSDLETRLLYRLGIDTASTLEANRIREALNAAIAKVASDGMSGATVAFSAVARGTVSLTIDSHTANASTLTVTDTLTGLGIFPGDWFVDSASVKHIIYSVDETTKTLGLGSPYATQLTGTITVTRRSFQLPTDGPVTLVRHDTDDVVLTPSTLTVGRWGFETGTPEFFAQRYSEDQEVSYLALSPAPDTAGEIFVIEQSKIRGKLVSATAFDFPEPILNGILEEARKIHLGWSGEVGPVEAQVAIEQTRDFKDQLRKTGGDDGLLRKR